MDQRGKLVISYDPQFKAPAETCPYFPASVVPTQPNPLAELTVAAAIFADLVGHPAGVAQTEALHRISRQRSNQKRGPPTQTIL